MVDDAMAEFLEGGCSLVVGLVSADGAPLACRGWGLTLLSREPLRARLFVSAEDRVAVDHLGGGTYVAVTAADVRTLRSLQLKGRSAGVDSTTDDDLARAERYVTAFFGALVEVDRDSPRLLERFAPAKLAASIVTFEEVFDQTPGPGAGARVTGAS